MRTIAFAGNPNTGKSAIINALAGSNLEVGNWSGVTVEKKEVSFRYEEEEIHIFDLPGVYTLSPYTLEERVTREFLCKESVDGIINVINTTDLRRNLYLTLELLDLQKPMVIALNMFDEFSKRGFDLDIQKLESIFGISCVATIGSKKLGVQKVKEKAFDALKHNKVAHLIKYQEHIEKEIEFLMHKMERFECNLKRFFAVKLLENDTFALQNIQKLDANLVEVAQKARERLQNHFQMDVKEFIVQDRYQKIDTILEKVLQKPLMDKVLLTDKIDSLVLHKWLGIPLFLTIMFLMFKLTFDGSTPLVNWMGGFFENFIAPHLRYLLQDAPPWLSSLLSDGLISGVGLVLSFLPLLSFLYFFMALLEESGYMARISFLLDKLAASMGIKGNAFIPLVVGFGCNVPAVYSTRTMGTLKERIITTMMIPFMSCSARLPTYVLFTSLFFPQNQALVILSLYLLGISIAFLIAFVANRFLAKSDAKPFFIELPTYHAPTWRSIWVLMWPKLKDFILKAGTVIVLASLILWGIINLPTSATPQTSYLAKISKEITPLFKPLGFAQHWESVAVLIPGTLAKELIIGSFGTIYGVESANKSIAKGTLMDDLLLQSKALFSALSHSFKNIFNIKIQSLETQQQSNLQKKIKEQFPSPAAAYSYLVFILLYIPCVSTMAAIKSEFGWKFMLFEIIFLPLLAYAVSFLIYQGLK